MSYLSPNPYTSLPPAFPPQGGLGGQPSGFPGPSQFGAPGGFPGPSANPMAALQGLQGGGQPDPMAALQGLQGGLPGAQQADPMAALQGLQGGGFPGAAGMGQDTFAPSQPAGAPQGAQPPAAQGQQAGVFQHQSGGFADKNSSLSSGGSFWTSGKGIASIAGILAGTAYVTAGLMNRKNWNPLNWFRGAKDDLASNAQITGTFNGIKDKAKTGLEDIKDSVHSKIEGLVKDNKTDEIKKLADDSSADIKKFVDEAVGYKGVAGELDDKQKEVFTNYKKAHEELFEAAKAGNLNDKLEPAKTAHKATKDAFDKLKVKVANDGFGKRQPVSELLTGLAGKNKADITTAIKDKEDTVKGYTDGLKELVEGDSNTSILDALKTKFDAISGAADDGAAKTAVQEFQTAFDKIDSDILKKGGTHTKAIQEALTGEAGTLKDNVIKATQLENGGATFKDDLSKLKEKAGKLLKDDQGTEQLTQSLDDYLKPENFGKQEAKEKFQKAFNEVADSKLAQTPSQKAAADAAKKAAEAKAAAKVARGHYDNLPKATNKLTGDDLKAKVEAAKTSEEEVQKLAQAVKADADKDFNPVLTKAEAALTEEQKQDTNNPVETLKYLYDELFEVVPTPRRRWNPTYQILGQDKGRQEEFAAALKDLEAHFPQT